MDVLTTYFAGAERAFRLRLGEFLNLEEACGTGMGVLYQRFGMVTYSATDIREVLIQGLIGGGMTFVEAEKLVKRQIDVVPLLELGSLAGDIIMAAMAGIPPDETSAPRDPAEPFDAGKIFHSFLQVGLLPDQVREMRYSDFVALMRASGGKDVQPPSEAEFDAMIRAWEDRQEG